MPRGTVKSRVFFAKNRSALLTSFSCADTVKSPESKLTGRKRKRDEDSDDSYAEGDERDESSSASVSEEDDVSASEESSVSERPKKKRKFGKFQAKKKEYEVPKVKYF